MLHVVCYCCINRLQTPVFHPAEHQSLGGVSAQGGNMKTASEGICMFMSCLFCGITPSDFVCVCLFIGTTMCSTTCWLEPVKRRGSPSTCSNLRNTTTSTRSAYALSHTVVLVHAHSQCMYKAMGATSCLYSSDFAVYMLHVCSLCVNLL